MEATLNRRINVKDLCWTSSIQLQLPIISISADWNSSAISVLSSIHPSIQLKLLAKTMTERKDIKSFPLLGACILLRGTKSFPLPPSHCPPRARAQNFIRCETLPFAPILHHQSHKAYQQQKRKSRTITSRKDAMRCIFPYFSSHRENLFY